VSRSDSVLAGALEDHNDEDEGCDMCGPSFTCDVKLVLDEVPGLLAAIDELEARNAKLEAVARDDVRDMANFCIAQGASKPWQEIARRLLAALDALDG
jgi:hypothetical protein